MAAEHAPTEQQLETWFDSYLRVANRHTFEELPHFLAGDLVANGRPGREGYVAELRAVARGFPDFRRTLQGLVINPDGWLGARFRTSGTHLGTFDGLRPTGASVSLDEVAAYRVNAFMIVEIRSTFEWRQLRQQIQARRF